MRTTIDVPDHILRRAKAAASLQGKSLKTFFTEALEERVASSTRMGSGRRVRFPLVPSSRPGSVDLSSDDISRILEAEDSGVSAGR